MHGRNSRWVGHLNAIFVLLDTLMMLKTQNKNWPTELLLQAAEEERIAIAEVEKIKREKKAKKKGKKGKGKKK